MHKLIVYIISIFTVELSSPGTKYSNVLYEASSMAGKKKWKEIGIALKLHENELISIETKYPGDLEKCYKAMLDKWFESSDNCYFVVFVDAMRADSVKLSSLIPHLEETIYKYADELQENTSGQKGWQYLY